MATTLDQILARTLLTVQERKQTTDLTQLERQAALHTPRGFASALRRAAKTGPAVIAELKRASPSRGLIREDFDPAELARSLAGAGAGALSVLTDEPFFQGSLAYLTQASAAVTIPVLRKDFMIDPFQLVEARAAGADAVLLIVAALDDRILQELAAEARQMSLDVLCEVHNEAELMRVLDLDVDLIGVNSRDLKTLQVHATVHDTFVEKIPPHVIRVAESGLQGPADLERLMKMGYDAFLIGEALMRQLDPAAALTRFISVECSSQL